MFQTALTDNPELARWANGLSIRGASGTITAADVASVERTADDVAAHYWRVPTGITLPEEAAVLWMYTRLLESFPDDVDTSNYWVISPSLGTNGLVIDQSLVTLPEEQLPITIFLPQNDLAGLNTPPGGGGSANHVTAGDLQLVFDSSLLIDPTEAPNTGRLKYWLAVAL